MNYNKIYSNIVRRALLQNRKKSNGVYFEKHHILPKCLGGNDKKDNMEGFYVIHHPNCKTCKVK